MASFASWSALSFLAIPQWLGHQEMEIFRFSWVVRSGLAMLWNFMAESWAVFGFGSRMVVVAAELSEKNAI